MYGFPPVEFEYIYYVHQYDSDSVLIRHSRKGKDGREYKSETVYAFNTIRRVKTEPMDNVEVTLICSVSPDGRSFTETTNRKSTIGLFEDYLTKNTWSMSDDQNKLIISSFVSQGASPDKERVLPDMVFERMGEAE